VVVDVGVEEAGVELVDGRGVDWADVPQPMCLRTMAAFLVSTRPLSPLLRGRLLVCSMRSFSSNRATVC